MDELLGRPGVAADDLVLLDEMGLNAEFVYCRVIPDVSVKAVRLGREEIVLSPPWWRSPAGREMRDLFYETNMKGWSPESAVWSVPTVRCARLLETAPRRD